jgi:RNA polymerase sigma-70 factor (ECF subfamily)
LFRVAHNLALKRRRSRAWRALWQPWDVDAAVRLADPARNPEERLIAAARASEWRQTVRSLSDRDRQCLALRAEGLRYRDIARVLGISLGAVAKSMARTASRLLAHDGERR